MYESLISPFAEDQDRPHPFKLIIPESFETPEFSIDKLDKSKLPEDTLLYIFYNMMDDKLQLMAAELLYRSCYAAWPKECSTTGGPKCG